MVVWCNYCSLPIDTSSALQCQDCNAYVHISCIHGEKPSSLEGDMLFDLRCKNCGSDDEGEEVKRMRITWVQAIHLALYNLAVRESGRQGFFRWKDDICGFIHSNWNSLFPTKPMTNNWRSTVAGTLSVYCPKLFKSGQGLFNETGWWSLLEVKPPPRSYGENVKAKAKTKSKEVEQQSNMLQKVDFSFGRGKRKQKQTLSDDVKNAKNKDVKRNDEKPAKTRDIEITKRTKFDNDDIRMFKEEEKELIICKIEDQDEFLNMESTGDNIADFSISDDAGMGNSELILNNDPFSLLRVEEIGKSISANLIPEHPEELSSIEDPVKSDVVSETASEIAKAEPVSKEDVSQDSSQEQTKAKTRLAKSHTQVKPRLVPMNALQENEFLYRLNCYPRAIADNPAARRLQRKLKLRKLKREMSLPILNIDENVRERIRRSAPTGIDVTFTDELGREIPRASSEDQPRSSHTKNTSLHHPALQGVNVLERFQTNFKTNRRQQSEFFGSFLSRLVGRKDDADLRTIVSPYTHRLLKPYIRRDYDTKPLKLRLMNELLYYTHRFDQHWIQPCPSSIDYCYVQPHHIPAVNAMCGEFFWNGIDLSESLQYPDFSCVVLYRKLLIGFAFMVPDVKYNEAYISFVLVHPDWQKAGIGTFMIYHLVQTCMGKDVTLHVSASNPSMLLYQKFGFKAEEYILDFYDKYLPEHSNECKHAFFLRLQR
eukprot:gene7842-8691_t